MTTSIIIPAHDEERALGATLQAVLSNAQDDEFDVVVVANGCTDGTESLVRSFAPAVRLLRIDTASKTAALNAAEQSGLRGSRIYLDADVVMPTLTARALVTALDVSQPVLAVPTPDVVQPTASWLVRSYNSTWYRLSALRGDCQGTGVYALNSAAREMFIEFPAVIADDLFIHKMFEGRCVQIAESVRVRPPQTFSSLMKVRTRVFAGNYVYLAERASRLRSGRLEVRPFLPLLARPDAWPGMAAYVLITLAAKLSAGSRLRQDSGHEWSQDLSTRL